MRNYKYDVSLEFTKFMDHIGVASEKCGFTTLRADYSQTSLWGRFSSNNEIVVQ